MLCRSLKFTAAFFLSLLITAYGIRGSGHVAEDDTSNKGRLGHTYRVIGEGLTEIYFLSFAFSPSLSSAEAYTTVDSVFETSFVYSI